MKKYSASWWQLYTNMEGAEEVAKAITANLHDRCRVACTNMAQDDLYTAKKAGNWIYNEMSQVLIRNAEYGASDTEPRAELREWIRKKFNVEVG